MTIRIKRRESLCRFSRDDHKAQDRDIAPLLQRIYEHRNVSGPEETIYALSKLHPPSLLKGIDEAVRILSEAVRQQSSIMIIGDYDTDGATATTLGLLALQAMGTDRVEYLVPNRFEFGYGLSEKIAALAVEQSPDLVITVDNGISSLEGVALLKQHGVRVIITDHHLAGDRLPEADAIVNPNQPQCEFPSKALAGVGVMFYLLLALRVSLRESGWFEQAGLAEPNLADFLDLVALGTVADMVPLDFNNRILVSQGIARIRSGKCRVGIIALLEAAGKSYSHLVSSDFGFVVAPRLNAAGRLDDISTGIECLISNERVEAKEYALILNDINIERRKIEKVMQSQAFGILRELELKQADSRIVVKKQGFCLFDASWHQGITGLVASRIKDKTHQPAIIFAQSDDGLMTGSARSVPGLHIRDLIESIANQEPELIVKFGGHAMAAGLTVSRENLNKFKELYHFSVSEYFLQNSEVEPVILSDGELSDAELTLEYAELLRSAAPWGQGFPEPMFDGIFDVLDQRVVGDQHIKFTLRSAEGAVCDAIAFKAIDPGAEQVLFQRILAAYQLDANEFRGQRSLQLIIENFEESSAV